MYDTFTIRECLARIHGLQSNIKENGPPGGHDKNSMVSVLDDVYMIIAELLEVSE